MPLTILKMGVPEWEPYFAEDLGGFWLDYTWYEFRSKFFAACIDFYEAREGR